MSAVEQVHSLGAGAAAFLMRVEGDLVAAVAHAPGATARAGSETLEAGGKRLRPLLAYHAAPQSQRRADGVAAAAVAVELVHMATLVHDDVLDAAPLRRGHPTVWATHGPALARATGDYLFARAFGVLTATRHAGAVELLASAALDMARGETLQARQAHEPDTEPEECLERCRLKTGRLFGAACALGGLLGGLERPDVDALDRFGVALGLAFQLADDVLDCDGDPETTGKALGTDLLDGTVTLPLLLAADRDDAVATALRDGVAADDVLDVLVRVAATGALQDTRAAADRYAAEALAELDVLGDRCDQRALRAIVQRATRRDS